MAKYAVEIIETLSRVVWVDAENDEEAYNLVYNDYRHQRIVLDAENRVDYQIIVDETGEFYKED